jgi:hypothetical protein
MRPDTPTEARDSSLQFDQRRQQPQTRLRIIDLEQVLLQALIERQKLSQAVTDPLGVLVVRLNEAAHGGQTCHRLAQ